MSRRVLISLAWLALTLSVDLSSASETSINYQGQLASGGAAVNGGFDLTFTLYALNSGGTSLTASVTNYNVLVTNGLFSTQLDFGAVFDGTARFLEIGVRKSGESGFQTLSPRQAISATPAAVYSLNARNLIGVSNLILGSLTTTSITATQGITSGTFGSTINDGTGEDFGSYNSPAFILGGDPALQSFAHQNDVHTLYVADCNPYGSGVMS